MRHTTTVVVGAGHCGLADESPPRRTFGGPRRPRTRRGGALVAHPAVGLAAAAHPELDDPAAGLRLPRRRPGRLPRRARGGRLIADYAAESAAPVLTGTRVTSVRPAAGGYVVRTDRGSWHARTVVAATGAAAVASVPAALAAQLPAEDPHGDRRGLPQPRPAPTGRRAGRGRLGQRRPDRRRAAPLRTAGHAGRRRARADAADLPGPRHPLVDGRVGPARRALRRDRRTSYGPATCPRCS